MREYIDWERDSQSWKEQMWTKQRRNPLYLFYDTTDTSSPDQLVNDLDGLFPYSSVNWMLQEVLFHLHFFFG